MTRCLAERQRGKGRLSGLQFDSFDRSRKTVVTNSKSAMENIRNSEIKEEFAREKMEIDQ